MKSFSIFLFICLLQTTANAQSNKLFTKAFELIKSDSLTGALIKQAQDTRTHCVIRDI